MGRALAAAGGRAFSDLATARDPESDSESESATGSGLPLPMAVASGGPAVTSIKLLVQGPGPGCSH
jgi:hypothetical protein